MVQYRAHEEAYLYGMVTFEQHCHIHIFNCQELNQNYKLSKTSSVQLCKIIES